MHNTTTRNLSSARSCPASQMSKSDLTRSSAVPVIQRRRRIKGVGNLNFECGCYFEPEDSWDACCPIHNMPMKLGTIDYADLDWVYRELSIHGVFGVEDIDDGH